jgi:hypothetical protein
MPDINPMWSKNSNGLKWCGLGLCACSLFEWASPTQKWRLQSCFHEVIDHRGSKMLGASLLVYVTGTVLLRNECLTAESRILRGQIKGRLLLSEAAKATLAEIAHRLGRMVLEDVAATTKPDGMSTRQRDELLTQSKVLEKETSPPRKRRTSIPKQSPTKRTIPGFINRTVVRWHQLLLISRSAGVLANHRMEKR